MNKQIVHDALILTAFTLVIGVILGAVYGITKTPIDKANEQTKKEAYQAVFKDADAFNEKEYDADEADKLVADAGYDDTIDDVEEAVDKDGNALGYVITVTAKDGSQGSITFSVGIQNDGTVNGYSITDISETPGLGMKAEEEDFYSQFQNKKVDQFTVVKQKPSSDDQIEAIGAGDQGMMFGFATNETEEYMPYPIALAHKLARQLTKIRKDGTLPYLRPDGKTQVTVEYDENGKPARLDAVVLSTQHDPDVTQEQIHEDIKKHVFDVILPQELVDENTKFFVNPTGRFVIGGPHGDSGLTGRKIIVDTYGGYARHGGGAFTGKDCTKVDRSAAYAARYAAKNIVAAGLADKCEIQLSYAIGVARPTSVRVDTFGTGKLSDTELVEIVRENFDLRPAGIIKMLDLRRPIYKQTAAYGHFGRTDVELPWENTDKAEDLKKYLK